jgi:hypothetical protein
VRRVALACGVMLALSGCGSSSSSSSSSTATAASGTTTSTTSTTSAASATTASTTTSARKHKPTTTTTTSAGAASSVSTAPPPTPAGTPPAPDGLSQTTGYGTYELCSGHCAGAVPASLRRGLNLPPPPARGGCPAAAGSGPVKPSVTGTLLVAPFIGSSWNAGRITWTAPPSVTGPILIRGRALAGSHAVGFGEGHRPYDELQLYAAPGKPHAWPSFTRVRGPGCYAYQVDTASSSAVISFSAGR